MQAIKQKLWAFALGDLPPDEFGRWLTACPEVEELIGGTSFHSLIKTNFSDQIAIFEAKCRLAGELGRIDPPLCACREWRADERLPLGFETDPPWFASRFETVAIQTPWLELVRCRRCGSNWYVATDTRDDDYYFHRLSDRDVESIREGKWPSTFDQLSAVWPDREWLDLFGYESLEDWRRKNPLPNSA